MKFFDAAFVLDKNGNMIELIWENELLKEKYSFLWNDYIGMNFDNTFPEIHADNGFIKINDEGYSFLKMILGSDYRIIFLSLENRSEAMYKKVLDLLEEGIQIYDKNGYLIYCNRAARHISAIPDFMVIADKHLLDIWNVDENISTTLSCLRIKAPVINRVDTFSSVYAGNITTINASYPIFSDEGIEGAVLFERNLQTIQKQKEKLESCLNALEVFTKASPSIKKNGYTFEHIIGNSKILQTAVRLAQKFSTQGCNMLLIGETGTGKEMFAQSIHNASLRRDKKFVAVNCAAIPETLIESMLFGSTKGAFTGSENKAGLFEEADGGTLFLDELNSMSLAMQSKILRVIQEGTFRRIGSNKDLHTDVRILSSCNESPFELVEQNRMRKDLFYRLSSVQVRIPPLRERLEDLEPLIENYIKLNKCQFAKAIEHVHPEVMELFSAYHWPGNVRELFHVLDYSMNVMENGVIECSCLPDYLVEKLVIYNESASPVPVQNTDFSHAKLEDIMGDYESAVLKQVLEYYGNNISRAANSLGICRQSLSYRIHKYGIVI